MNSGNEAGSSHGILGVVLSGGQSSRMGSDKGLLSTEGQTWTEKAAVLLQEVCSGVVISVNREQFKTYQSIFPNRQLVADKEDLPVKGPLLGLLSAHLLHPEKDIFLLACDMINMKEEVIHSLKKIYREAEGHEAFAFLNPEQAEPLCAIYTGPALSRILEKYTSGNAKQFSMRYVLDSLDLLRIPLPATWTHSFSNMNTPGDLS